LIDYYVDAMVMNSTEADYQLYSLVSIKNLIIFFQTTLNSRDKFFGSNVIVSMLLLICTCLADGLTFYFTIEA
jgi:hypothetical protein